MPVRKSGKKPSSQIKLAKERIEILFDKAEKEFDKNPELSHRWVQMARKISTRYNIRFTKEQKRRLCKKCMRFLVPGKNSSVRTNPKQQAVIIKCLECGNVMRFPYRSEKKQAKSKRPSRS